MGAKMRAGGMSATASAASGWLRKSGPNRRKKHQADRTHACGKFQNTDLWHVNSSLTPPTARWSREFHHWMITILQCGTAHWCSRTGFIAADAGLNASSWSLYV
jgi:hypothetical protein